MDTSLLDVVDILYLIDKVYLPTSKEKDLPPFSKCRDSMFYPMEMGCNPAIHGDSMKIKTEQTRRFKQALPGMARLIRHQKFGLANQVVV